MRWHDLEAQADAVQASAYSADFPDFSRDATVLASTEGRHMHLTRICMECCFSPFGPRNMETGGK